MLFDVVDNFMRPLPFLTQSLLSTAFISIVPIFMIYGLYKCFLNDEKSRDSFTYILLSFAMGGLLGDVFFHTLPHLSSGGHDHGHGDSGKSHEHNHEHNDHDHGSEAHNESNGSDHGGHGHSHSEEDMQLNLIIIIGILSFFLIEKITHTYFSDGHSHDHGHDHGHAKNKKVQVAENTPVKSA